MPQRLCARGNGYGDSVRVPRVLSAKEKTLSWRCGEFDPGIMVSGTIILKTLQQAVKLLADISGRKALTSDDNVDAA